MFTRYERSSRMVVSIIEERGFTFAAQPDVEAVRTCLSPFRDQPRTERLRNSVENRIRRELEEHHRLQLPHEAGIDQAEVDVGDAPGHYTRANGAEAVQALAVGRCPSPAEKCRVVVTPFGIRLPDLEHEVIDRLAVRL